VLEELKFGTSAAPQQKKAAVITPKQAVDTKPMATAAKA
jgi:hypothetical protein